MKQPPESDSSRSLWPLTVLGIVVSILTLFTSKRNQFGEAIQPQDNTANTSAHRKEVRTIVANIVPPPPEQQETRTTCRPDQTPWWKTFGEGVAIFTGLALLILNFCQLRSNQRQLSDSEAIQAANLVLEDVQQKVRFPEPGKMEIVIDFNLRNSGPTSAVHVSGGISSGGCTDEWLISHTHKEAPQTMPGETVQHRSYSSGIWPVDQENLCLRIDFIYDDIFGGSHYATLCRRYQGHNEIGVCSPQSRWR